MVAAQPQPIISDSTTIPTYSIGSDMVILMGETALVSSKSDPGSWRAVDVVRSLCACPGFLARGKCRHVEATRKARIQATVTALAAEYQEYLAWAKAVGTEPMDVQGWYEARDYPEDELAVDPVAIPNQNGLVWTGFKRGWLAPEAL